mmetsp:Transcript_51690/g.102790  ORF Transcript_51690/g.102790 Transcript_51690/m.102790 type:complete len:213 (+) Transcript_51690:322-960(+)
MCCLSNSQCIAVGTQISAIGLLLLATSGNPCKMSSVDVSPAEEVLSELSPSEDASGSTSKRPPAGSGRCLSRFTNGICAASSTARFSSARSSGKLGGGPNGGGGAISAGGGPAGKPGGCSGGAMLHCWAFPASVSSASSSSSSSPSNSSSGVRSSTVEKAGSWHDGGVQLVLSNRTALSTSFDGLHSPVEAIWASSHDWTSLGSSFHTPPLW